MTIAELHGKIAGPGRYPVDSSEDLLTSNVFGAMRYMPPELGIIPFFSTAQCLDGSHFTVGDQVSRVDWSFWPYLDFSRGNACEPDLVIGFHTTEGLTIAMVEVKYRSDKSSHPDDEEHPRDQLARELDSLQALSDPASFLGWPTSLAITGKALIYVTQDAVMPRDSIRESLLEYRLKRTADGSDMIYWTSWRTLFRSMRDSLSDTDNDFYRAVIRDIMSLMSKKSLKGFDGMAKPAFDFPYDLFSFYARPDKPYDWPASAVSAALLPDFKYRQRK